jgi:transposase
MDSTSMESRRPPRYRRAVSLPKLGPAPCDGCSKQLHCRVTELCCLSFHYFVIGDPWRAAPREPSPIATALATRSQKTQLLIERAKDSKIQRRENRRGRYSKRRAAPLSV